MIIFLVDDQSTNTELISELFEKVFAGVQIHFFEDEQRMLLSLKNDLKEVFVLPDLILIELTMPGLDLYQLLSELHTYSAKPDISVAFFSRSSDSKLFLSASRLNIPLFVKGKGISGLTKAVADIATWYNELNAGR